MKFIKLYLIIFICLIHSVKVDSKQNLINELKDGGNLIFIRHAYAPGSGDPAGFDINNCSTQRNLSNKGIEQAKKIGSFLQKKKFQLIKFILVSGVDVKKLHQLLFKIMKQKIF